MTMGLPKDELVRRMVESEKHGDFDFNVEPIDTNSFDKVEENYRYFPSSLGQYLLPGLIRFIAMLAGVFINHIAFGVKVKGRRHLRGIKSAVLTCNHVNNLDNLLVRNAVFGHRLYIVVGEFNNKKGFFGKCLKAGGTLPLSTNLRAMVNFRKTIEKLLKRRSLILFYPEEAEWWNYEKPRPFKNGAFHFAVTSQVPVIPVFLTFAEPKGLRARIIKGKVVTVNIMPPIFPLKNVVVKDNVDYLRRAAYVACVEKYEETYKKPMVYDTIAEGKPQHKPS